VIRIILAFVWSLMASGLYLFMNFPTTTPAQRSHVELFFWLALGAAGYNFIRWCVDAWLRKRRRNAEIERRLEEPKGPVVHPEFRLEDADERITRREDV
jgi:hypothetical protein